jgi:hypothetical protein
LAASPISKIAEVFKLFVEAGTFAFDNNKNAVNPLFDVLD